MLSTGALMVREWVVEAKTRQSAFGATRFPALQKSSKRLFLRYRLKDKMESAAICIKIPSHLRGTTVSRPRSYGATMFAH